jgi:tripartite-type tricarboxylate transporter receptor subunit TctC
MKKRPALLPMRRAALATVMALAMPAAMAWTNKPVRVLVPAPMKDIRPVAAVARSRMVLVGAPTLPAKDLPSLVSYVKANPGKLSFASNSAGTASHEV